MVMKAIQFTHVEKKTAPSAICVAFFSPVAMANHAAKRSSAMYVPKPQTPVANFLRVWVQSILRFCVSMLVSCDCC